MGIVTAAEPVNTGAGVKQVCITLWTYIYLYLHVLTKGTHLFDSKTTVFDWSDEKDFKLRKERGIGFDDIVFHIASGDLLGVVPHPNTEKYPNQK